MTTDEPRYEPLADDAVVERPVDDHVERVRYVRDERPVSVASDEAVEVTVARVFTPARILGIAAGAVLIIFGLVALARGDLSGSVDEPVVKVAGWSHTPLLGLIEIGAGVLLVLSSSVMSMEMMMGAVIAVGGIVALIEPKVLSDNLSIDSGLAWLVIILGAVPFAAAAITRMMPLRTRHTRTVTDLS